MKQIGIGVCALFWALPASAQTPWSKEELAAGTRTSELTRYAPAGKKVQLYTLAALDLDCRVTDTTADIVKAPEHGTALVEDAEHFVFFSKDNSRHKCSEKKIRGPVLTYRAAPGYAGADNLEVLIITHEGFAQRYVFTINVVDPKARR
jgi:hypothetical protein